MPDSPAAPKAAKRLFWRCHVKHGGVPTRTFELGTREAAEDCGQKA